MNERPIFLNLLALRHPIPSIVSFLHRLSGLFLALLIPLLLWALQESLTSTERFEALKMYVTKPWLGILLWLLLAALIYHLLAGIRHLLTDIHVGESIQGGRIGAWIVLGLFVLGALVAGFFVWNMEI